jgi:hygromycin-B 7''-O-kinase
MGGPSIVDTSSVPTFIHADLHADHLYVDPTTGELLAVIDFGDAWAGDPRYDFQALHCGSFHGDRDMLAAAFDGYGATFEPEELLAFTFLHQFSLFSELPDEITKEPRTLEALGERLWRPAN